MENIDAHFAPIRLPEVLSVESIPEDKRPLLKDWKLVQGGMPEVVPVRPEIGLFNVIHRYKNTYDPAGTGAVIPTSVPLVENWGYKKITMTLPDGRRVEFPTALLWKYHGKGCESRSGTKYERVTVND